MHGELHAVGEDLFIIEGQHATSVWHEMNVPNIAVYRAGDTLYLLDTGICPPQREAIRTAVRRLGGAFARVVLLNSHGHADHVGNNAVLHEIPARETRHFISEQARELLRFREFFTAAYAEGTRYFNYLEGLDLSPAAALALLQQLGAAPGATPALLTQLGRLVQPLGLGPVLNRFVPVLLVEALAHADCPSEASEATMQFYETLPRQTFQVGAATWTGWAFGPDDVWVFEARGHSKDGVLFYVPRHKFLFFADETTTVPIWPDSDADNAERTIHRALAMLDAGAIEIMAAGHFPREILTAQDRMRQALSGMVASKQQFDQALTAALQEFPQGASIDTLYEYLRTHRSAGDPIAFLLETQFPKAASFLKLTVLHWCRKHRREGLDAAGRPIFLPDG
jgi:glyoxylase-like metal-dependent hydrolase (beta-lactamase superfamily II)